MVLLNKWCFETLILSKQFFSVCRVKCSQDGMLKNLEMIRVKINTTSLKGSDKHEMGTIFYESDIYNQ